MSPCVTVHFYEKSLWTHSERLRISLSRQLHCVELLAKTLSVESVSEELISLYLDPVAALVSSCRNLQRAGAEERACVGVVIFAQLHLCLRKHKVSPRGNLRRVGAEERACVGVVIFAQLHLCHRKHKRVVGRVRKVYASVSRLGGGRGHFGSCSWQVPAPDGFLLFLVVANHHWKDVQLGALAEFVMEHLNPVSLLESSGKQTLFESVEQDFMCTKGFVLWMGTYQCREPVRL